jgi:hypothetical protein
MSGTRLLLIGMLCAGPAVCRAGDDAGRAAVSTEVVIADSIPAGPATAVSSRFWASADYVFGWLRGAQSPPLLSARPVGGGPPTILFPNGNLNDDGRSGFQLRGGLWIDDGQSLGIEAGTLYLCESTDRARVGNDPGTIIGRPFFNALLGAPDVELVSAPGILSGQAVDIATASHFCGADIALRKAICCDCRGRLDVLVGYRFLSFDDSVEMLEDLHPSAAPFPPGSRIGVGDRFEATNRFDGLLLGLAGEYRLDGWFVEGRLAVSTGRTARKATIAGQTQFDIPPEAPFALPGGLLALSTNSGIHSSDSWTVVPEATVRVGYQVNDRLRVFAGYSALYWPGVYRAASQIDPAINPDLLPPVIPTAGPARPLFPNRTSGLWGQFLSVGAELRF